MPCAPSCTPKRAAVGRAKQPERWSSPTGRCGSGGSPMTAFPTPANGWIFITRSNLSPPWARPFTARIPTSVHAWLQPLVRQLKHESAAKVVRQLEAVLANVPAGPALWPLASALPTYFFIRPCKKLRCAHFKRCRPRPRGLSRRLPAGDAGGKNNSSSATSCARSGRTAPEIQSLRCRRARSRRCRQSP